MSRDSPTSIGALSYELAAQVRLTWVITQPRLKRTLWLDSFEELRLDENEEPQDSDGQSSSESSGEMGPGEVEREDRHETSLVLLHGGFVH